jgi:hypothetical protein
MVIKTNQLTLYKDTAAVCPQMHTKHVNALFGEKVERLYVQPGGI